MNDENTGVAAKGQSQEADEHPRKKLKGHATLDIRVSADCYWLCSYCAAAHLGYPLSDYLKKPSPRVIVIPPLNQRNGATAPNDRLPYHNAHRRVKDFLKDLLRPEVERHETHPIPALKQAPTSSQIVDGLRHQLDAYWHNEWPFDQL